MIRVAHRHLARACCFYAQVCGWRVELVDAGHRSYHALEWGGPLHGGVVECGTSRAAWLPYVEVARVDEATERARRLGATVLLDPREGPSGWRSVIAVPDGAELAFWQPKEAACGDDRSRREHAGAREHQAELRENWERARGHQPLQPLR